jgi:DNA-binding protein H-NS
MGEIMKKIDWDSMSVEVLWELHEKVAATLAARLADEKSMLENRLRQLGRQFHAEEVTEKSGRRPYPVVFPKFRNPEQPSETWAGRGKKPKWLTRQLKSGKRMDDFRIAT